MFYIGHTYDPALSRFLLAQRINRVFGGPFVTPFDVDELDEMTIDAVIELEKGRPAMVAGLKKVEDHLADFRKRHGYKS